MLPVSIEERSRCFDGIPFAHMAVIGGSQATPSQRIRPQTSTQRPRSRLSFTQQRKIRAMNEPLPDAGDTKQRPLDEAKRKADPSGPQGKPPREVAERANLKRQQKQMHKQD